MCSSDLFKQYLQSKMQQLVKRIFNNDIHLPSEANEWHIPDMEVLPSPLLLFLLLPLDEQEASYLALSAKIVNFSCNPI